MVLVNLDMFSEGGRVRACTLLKRLPSAEKLQLHATFRPNPAVWHYGAGGFCGGGVLFEALHHQQVSKVLWLGVACCLRLWLQMLVLSPIWFQIGHWLHHLKCCFLLVFLFYVCMYVFALSSVKQFVTSLLLKGTIVNITYSTYQWDSEIQYRSYVGVTD